MAASGAIPDTGRRLLLLAILALAVVLAAAAWAGMTAVRMRDRELETQRALADLHRMRHATRALLSARRSFPELAAVWSASVTAFSTSFAGLVRDAGGGRLHGLEANWAGIQDEVPPVRAAINTLGTGPLAGSVGDEGVEQTALRLLADRHATRELLELRRLQRHLGAFDIKSEGFASRLAVAAGEMGAEAAAATRLASACAGILLLGGGAAAVWLLLRISLLNLDLRRTLDSLGRSQAESAHREQVLRAVLDGLGEGVLLIGADGRLVWANPAAQLLAGPAAALRPGAAWQGLLDLCDRDGRALGLRPGDGSRRWLDVQLRRGGDTVRIDLAVAPVATAGEPPGLVVVLVDLTARRALEEQLRHAQSLESLGRLAGGVAHDFNNLLAGILGNAELLGTRLSDRPELRQRVDTIITAGTRAAALTRQLLDSARRSAMQRSRVDVHRLVRETVALLGRTLDRRIAIAVDLQAPASWLDGDAALLQNALVNLAINARDAMPEGGRLRIATAAAAPPEGAAGAWMSISVADTGCGIPADVLPHVCEAFFTTKPVGKGSGLGLAAVQGTVQRHGGRMAIASEVGRGTEITILLPVAAPPDTARRERLETRTPRPGLRLLLVDDEDLVRTMAEEELAELGYQVQAFADGHLAVAALAADPDACDGAVLDLVMPRIGGVETLQRLRAIRPDLPVLLWSGYSAGHDVEPLLSDGRTAFIAKPATHEALGRALAGLLAHPPAR